MPVLTVVHLTAHSPRGTDFVAITRPPLSWRVQTDCRTVDPGPRRARASPRRSEWRAAVVGEDSVRVPWPFEPLSVGRGRRLRVRVSGSGETRATGASRCGSGRLPRGRRVGGDPSGSPNRRDGAARVLARDRVRRRRCGRPRHALRDRGRRVPGGDQRRRRRRPGDEAGLDVVPVPHHPRDDRRHRSAAGRAQRDRRAARRRLGDGAVRVPDNARRVYGDQPPSRPSCSSSTSTGDGLRCLRRGWRTSTGPLLASGLYAGEDYDAASREPGCPRPATTIRVGDRLRRDAISSPRGRVSPPVRRFERCRSRR